MKKLFLLGLTLIICALNVYAYSDLDKIERDIFNRTFEFDPARSRIERLESKIFGAVQYGTYDERMELLKSAAKSYKAYNPDNINRRTSVYNQYRPPIFTGTMGSNWKNTLWGNLRNQMMGMPTGFTPAMDPAYMDYFEAERAMAGHGQQIDYRTNTGYRRSNSDRASGMGVRILD